uniref:Carboxypeptidase n=1 Tax=Picea sitchensis TaxID=3332 RepID=B8LLR6_PICSI|nr:unknown [Picea sitchensis]
MLGLQYLQRKIMHHSAVNIVFVSSAVVSIVILPKMRRILAAESLILFVLLGTAIAAPSHQRTTQGDALRVWRNNRRYKSHGLQTTNWGLDNALISFRNESEYLTESKAEGHTQEADYLPHGLPGQPMGIKFRQYSGYVTVDAKAGRALFYYFTEAVRDPSKQPLVLWLNGGPGCSSLGFGAMAEVGPFRVNPDGKTVHFNRYTWNQVANILFLESPAGVGFSYSNTSSDYSKHSGDRRTAKDAYTFLMKWFIRFPQYKFRDFYIAGESYAGNYIPELAATILHHQRLSQASFINFKGIMVGNGIMNSDTDNIGQITYPWTHALISDETYEGLINNCIKSNVDEILCEVLELKMSLEMGNIDPYSIYAPLCLTNSSELAKQEEAAIPGYDPCIDDYVSKYFNRPDVQKAIHANVTNLNHRWIHCSDLLRWNDSASTVLPIYRHLIARGLRILLFSGDTDTVVPVTSTRLSINELKLPIATPWYPWLNGDEVGGYTVIYKGLTFATVRGAGHEVPAFQPSRALTLFKSFLAGKPLPG